MMSLSSGTLKSKITEVSYIMNLKPLSDRLIVEPTEQDEMTPSGIILPETAKEKPMQGKVLAVGPGARKDDGSRIAMDVQPGNTVLYAKYAGTEVKMDSKKYLILRESDVLAIVE
jgi:chaperonin GroES